MRWRWQRGDVLLVWVGPLDGVLADAPDAVSVAVVVVGATVIERGYEVALWGVVVVAAVDEPVVLVCV